MSKYEENKATKVGSTIICPTCGKEFVKKQYSQAFCSRPCKDKFWNDIGDRHKSKEEETPSVPMRNGIYVSAVGTVFTNTDPMNLYVERDQWAALLGQFDNGQRVRIILVKEDAE